MPLPAVLSLFNEAGACQFTWQPSGARPGPAILLSRQPWSPEADRAQRAELDRAARLLGQRILRPAASVQGATWTTSDPLLLVARLIYNRLPPAIAQALRELPAGSSLLIDAGDPELPWELAHDGEDYLALKYAVGRQFLLPQLPRRNPARPGRQFASLIIGNPTGDLPAADREVDELVRLIEATPGTAPPRILMRRRATRSAVLAELAGGAYDLIHFSGHAVLPRIPPSPAHGRGAGGEGAPETGGLILARDEVLSGAEIEQNLGGRPFVFLNGCETARSQAGAALTEGPDGLVYLGPSTASLAAAFVQGGARAALGAIWPVADSSAPDFVGVFYQAALRGTPAGEAVRQARRAARAADPSDPLWASFMFYGDPDAPLLPPPRTMRRPATVLVARLLGLDALSAGPGAEELAARLEEQVADLRAQIVRFGGQPQDLAHDLLIGAFGLPATRENDAERAVHAALAMAESTRQERQTADGRALGLALGLSSGDVLAGLAGEAREGDKCAVTLLGEAVNQAAWLARQAGDGVILAAEPVRRLTGSLFELVARPAAQPEGATSFAVYQVLGTRAGDVPRWQAPGYQAPLIGRAHELEDLQDAWRLCRQGRGQVVSVVGEAGSGKSRLLHEFRQRLGSDSVRWLAAACPSSHAPGPYELVADLLRGLLGLAPALDGSDADRQLRESLVRGLGSDATGVDLTEDVAILGEILAVPLRGLPQLQVEPRARQRRVVNLLGKLLARQAAETPLIVALDDLHWADEASLAVLNQMVGGFERLPVLLVALFRSEAGWQPPWWNRPSHRWLRLDALPEDAAAALLAALLAPEGLPADLARAILDRAGGNAFFLRELALAVRESASLPEADGARSLAPLPSTVQRLILTRIDALPEAAQRVLPMAAVAGDQVDVEVLAAALAETGDAAALDEGLMQLEAREFLYHRWGEPSYRFTHALLREVAYDALAADARPRVHLCLGRALERVYAGREVEALDLLAHHFDRSDDRRSALRYCLWAARRAADAWANTIALSWFGRTLAWVKNFAAQPPAEAEQEHGATPDQLRRWRVEAIEGQAGVQAAIGQMDEAIAGYTLALELVAGSAVFAAPRRADLYRKLAIALHDRGNFIAAQAALEQGLSAVGEQACLEAGRLHVWSGLLRFRRGELAEALVSCGRGIAILAQADSPQDLAQAYNLRGLVYRNMGVSGQAIEAHERSIALYAVAGDSAGLERATSNLGCVYQDLSRWPEALRHFERSAELAERTGEAWRRAAAAINLGEIYRRQGEFERAVAAYERARQIGDEFGFPEVTGMALMDLGASYLKQGEIAKAGEHLEAGLATFRHIGTDVYLPEILRYQAELELLGGRADEALLLAQHAVDWAVRLDRRLELGQAHRALGQVYAALGRPAEAETSLRESLSILEAQGSPYETALTLIEIARLQAAEAGEASHAQVRSTCDRAIAVFDELGARLDAERARELRQSL